MTNKQEEHRSSPRSGSETRCVLCGRDPATGYALIGDARLCHGDFEPDPTCYMRASWRKNLANCTTTNQGDGRRL